MSNRPQADLCDVCDQAATAWWRGHRTISICSTCAAEVLPALMADAISSVMVEDWDRSKRVFDQIESRFWRALVHRLLKERK